MSHTWIDTWITRYTALHLYAAIYDMNVSCWQVVGEQCLRVCYNVLQCVCSVLQCDASYSVTSICGYIWYEWVMSHMWMSHVSHRNRHMYDALFSDRSICGDIWYECVMLASSRGEVCCSVLQCVCRVLQCVCSVLQRDVSYSARSIWGHISYEWVMSHMWMKQRKMTLVLQCFIHMWGMTHIVYDVTLVLHCFVHCIGVLHCFVHMWDMTQSHPTHCNTLQQAATPCNTRAPWYTTPCTTLQHTANTLQHTATHCDTLRHTSTWPLAHTSSTQTVVPQHFGALLSAPFCLVFIFGGGLAWLCD